MTELGRPSCLFCTGEVIPVSTAATIVKENGRTVTVPVKTEDGMGSESGFILSDKRADEDVPIQNDLKSIFIVRKVLDLPEEKCKQYLRRKKDNYPNPGSWLVVCRKCNGAVIEYYRTYRKVTQLEAKLKGMKMAFLNLMRETDTIGGKRRAEWNVMDDIRACALELADSVVATSSGRPSRNRTTVKSSPEDAKYSFTLNSNVDTVDGAASPIPVVEDTNDNDLDWDPLSHMEEEEDMETASVKTRPEGMVKSDMQGMDINDESDDNGSAKAAKVAKVELKEPILNKKRRKIGKQKTVRHNYLYQCDQCPAWYRYTKPCREHQKLHSDPSALECPHCGWLCQNGKKLDYHLSCKHSNRMQHNISRRRGKRSKVNKHVYLKVPRILNHETPYYCDHCHMIYTTVRIFQRHNINHHADKPLVPCGNCSSKFISTQLLQIHIDQFHPDMKKVDDSSRSALPNDQKYECPECSESFGSKPRLDFHTARVHPLSLLKCKSCDFQANKYSNLLIHITKRHENAKLICDFCSKELVDRNSLKMHMSVYHYKEAGLDPLKCLRPGCLGVFTSPKALEKHILHVHDKVKELCCEHCGKAFARTCDLRKHVLLHTAPRELQYKKGPFICEHCPNAVFNVRQGLYYHMKKAHSDKYLCRCKKCGKGYTLQSMLLQHEKDCKGTGST